MSHLTVDPSKCITVQKKLQNGSKISEKGENYKKCGFSCLDGFGEVT